MNKKRGSILPGDSNEVVTIKKGFLITSLGLLLATKSFAFDPLEDFIDHHLTWFQQSSFVITSQSNQALYIDPVKVPANFTAADVILVTHSHYDHYNIETINRLSKKGTSIITPKNMAKSGWKGIDPWQTIQAGPFKITGVPAYNLKSGYHPKDEGWLGYIIEVDGVKIYHAGDTDLIPAMQGINVDIALVPIGGTYTMNVGEAVKASEVLKAKIFLPMHFGLIIGEKNDGLKFASLVKTAKVVLLQQVN